MPQPADPNQGEAARLKVVFQEVDLPKIEGASVITLSHAEIVAMLPPYGGPHPMKGLLIDRATGQAYGIASGWEPAELTHNGMTFRAGAMSPETAARAGPNWAALGNHLEPVAAAFMRRLGIAEAVLYINGRNPCWGTPDGTGCFYHMTEFLAEGSRLAVYNKFGSESLPSRPDRKFAFTGAAD